MLGGGQVSGDLGSFSIRSHADAADYVHTQQKTVGLMANYPSYLSPSCAYHTQEIRRCKQPSLHHMVWPCRGILQSKRQPRCLESEGIRCTVCFNCKATSRTVQHQRHIGTAGKQQSMSSLSLPLASSLVRQHKQITGYPMHSSSARQPRNLL